MDKSDVEMEDTEDHPHDSGSYVKELENNSNEENSPTATAVAEDAKKSENGGVDPIKPRNESEDSNTAMTQMERQINSENEVNEFMNVELSVEEQINNESKSDLGSNVRESENKLDDTKVEIKQENLPLATSVPEDAKKIENGGEDPNLSSNEPKDYKIGTSLMEGQISPKSGASEPTNAEGSVEKQITTKSKNEEIINSKNKDQEQIATRNAVHEQTNVMTEAVEQNPTNDRLKEEKSTEKCMDCGNHVNNVEEKPSEGKAEKAEQIGLTEKATEIVDAGNNSSENKQLVSTKSSFTEAPSSHKCNEDEEMVDVSNVNEGKEIKNDLKELSKEAAEDHSGETVKNDFTQSILPSMAEGDDGALEEQATFMTELESFFRERAVNFNPLWFYGEPLNFLKLWRSVIRLGGYDRVNGFKLWRQVGESFNPPKTCTTVSWTFRIFYETYLLEYERHRTQSGELRLPGVMSPGASGVDGEGNGYQGSGSGRARRDAASRTMQGWQSQHLSRHSEAGEPIIKDKNPSNMANREENIKSIGSITQKIPNDADHSIKAARTETSKQLLIQVADVGPSADWVKINVQETRDCFKVYALLPGLLREEVRVQSDPAGRLVIIGQPRQVNNPWGVTPFKKIVSFPARINPLQTFAAISLLGRLFVRVPFEHSKKSS